MMIDAFKKVIAMSGLLFIQSACCQSIDTTFIDSILKVYDRPDSPGLSLGIVKGNQLIYSNGYGLANLDYDIKNSDSTVLSLASISKQFTAAAVWSLIEEGKLRLEDDITQYLDDFPDYKRPIKIWHLLNHSSGIRNYHALMQLSGFDYHTSYYNNDSVYALLKRQKRLSDKPGTRMFYSNSNYTLLALIIEKITDQNLNSYLTEKVLTPLGMHDTYVRVSHGYPIKNKAVNYQKNGDSYHFNTSSQTSYGAGSMRSTVLDMSIWLRMLNGSIPEFYNLSTFLKTQDILNDGRQSNYARGLQVDDYQGHVVYSHSGYGYGSQSQMISVPSQDIGIIIMTNLQSINPNPLAYQLLNSLLPNQSADIVKNNYNPTLKNDHSGIYFEIHSDLKMTFAMVHDSLMVRGPFAKEWTRLKQVNENSYHRQDNEQVKYHFKNHTFCDLSIEFGGTPFYFKKTNIKMDGDPRITDYEGCFYSEELDVTYQLKVVDAKLVLSYPNNKFDLNYVNEDTFGNNNRTIYQFIRNRGNQISSFTLGSEGQIGDIEFLKTNNHESNN